MVRLFDLLNHSEDSSDDSKSPSVLSRDSGQSSSEATSTSTPSSMESNINLKRKLTDKGANIAPLDIKREETGNVANAAPYSKERPKINPLARQHPKVDDKGIVNSSSSRIYKLVPKTKIHKKFLDSKKFVQIAIRRKSSSKNSHNYNNEGEEEDQFNENNSTSKLHIKSLEAGLRVKLTFAPSLFSLYKSLTPNTNRKSNASVMNYDAYTKQSYAKVINEDEEALNAYNRDINDTNNAKDEVVNKSGFKPKNNTLVSKLVQLIDSNLVDLTKTSNKVLKTFNLNQDSNNDSLPASPNSKNNSFYQSPDLVPSQKKRKPNEASKKRDISPTFNSLSTAVQSLFGITDYTLVRVTRSTTNDSEGSVLLKLETAKPGDYKLFDDNEYISEMAHSIGQKGSVPSNLFIKKIVARPRYKSDMKIYIIPKLDDISFYLDSRMFERDLFYGVIDFDSPLSKKIYCNFEINEMIEKFRELLKLSEVEHQTEKFRKEIIENQDDETDSEVNDEGSSDSSSSQHELRSHPHSLKLNSASTGYLAPSPKAFSDSPTSDGKQFGFTGTNPEQPPKRLLHTLSESSAYPSFFSSDKLTPRPGSSSDNSSVVSRSGVPPVTKQTNSLPYVMPSSSSSSIPSLSSSSSISTTSSNSLATPHASASLSNPSSTSIISLPSHPLSSPKNNDNQRQISPTTLPPPSSIFTYLKEKKGY